MRNRYTVRCSGVRETGRRCTNMVDSPSEEGKRYCSHPDCVRTRQREYYQRPEAKAMNAARVRKRRQDPVKRAKETAAQIARDRRAREARRLARASV